MKRKTCTKCKKMKNISHYYKGNDIDNLKYWCKECCYDIDKETRDKNREHNLKHSLWTYAKKRAKQKGIEFTITENDFIIPEYCPILNIKLCFINHDTLPDSPTLDRLDVDKGYIPGNIFVISHKANTIKSYGTVEDHRKIVAWMENKISLDKPKDICYSDNMIVIDTTTNKGEQHAG